MSLKSQLLKAGLADEKKARKADHEKRLAARNPGADDPRQLAQQTLAEKAEHDRALNLAREQEKAAKALAAQIRQLVEAHRLERKDGAVAYQFTDARKVKKLHVTAAQQEQLVRGQIAVVRLADRYELVPAAVAERIRSRDAAAVVVLNVRPAGTPAEDDPYADYKIPDDLMW